MNDLSLPRGVADGEWVPDFNSLFPLSTTSNDWQFTPRTAAILYGDLCLLSELTKYDVGNHHNEPINDFTRDQWLVLDRLPKSSWTQSEMWRLKAARAGEDLAQDVADGGYPRPRCLIEEMMLYLALEDAPVTLRDEGEPDEIVPGLLRHRDDYDWARCTQRFFPDQAQHMRLSLSSRGTGWREQSRVTWRKADGLRPEAWFTAFADVEARNSASGL